MTFICRIKVKGITLYNNPMKVINYTNASQLRLHSVDSRVESDILGFLNMLQAGKWGRGETLICSHDFKTSEINYHHPSVQPSGGLTWPRDRISKSVKVNDTWMKISHADGQLSLCTLGWPWMGRDGMGREPFLFRSLLDKEVDPPGSRMGNTCTPMGDSCQCMAKTTTILWSN